MISIIYILIYNFVYNQRLLLEVLEDDLNRKNIKYYILINKMG